MREIPLTQGKVALVDDEDYERVAKYRWYAQGEKNRTKWYALRGQWNGVEQVPVRMHTFIMRAVRGTIIDHLNGDTLDNRKENLRACTNSQNTKNRGKQKNNTSGYKGVFAWGNRWRAKIQSDGVVIHLGAFDIKEDAARAYDREAFVKHGAFAKLNFPDERPTVAEPRIPSNFGLLSCLA